MAYDWKGRAGTALKSLSGGFSGQKSGTAPVPAKVNRPSLGSKVVGMFGKKKKKASAFDYEGNG